jgi:Mn-dependent DtxR family transcriptional regulator
MKLIPFLCCGNHPKGEKLRQRIVQIIKILKENKGKIEATELEKKLGISRLEKPAMFYKPLAALKKWDLVQVHKKVEFDEKGKKHFKTTYELTPELFYHYIQKTLLELVKKELEMI